MNMTDTIAQAGLQEVQPTLVIRTGRADGCQAHFFPEHYQLLLSRDGVEEKIDLGFSGSRLLERLLRAPGEVVGRDELLAYAWSDRIVGQGSLNQQIYALRQVLGDEKKREIIQTLPRRGYMFSAKFLGTLTVAPELAAPGLFDSRPLPRQVHRSLNQQRLAVLSIAGAALAILAAIVFFYVYYALFQSQVLVEERDLGNKHFVYAATTAQALAQLEGDTTVLSERLSGLTQQPVQFRLGANAGFFELLCVQRDTTRWMMINRAQIAKVSDEQLRSCLQ